MSAGPLNTQVMVNGEPRQRFVPPGMLLVEFLREELGLTGTHVGCNNGICGSCTVLVDGEALRACLLLAVQVDGQTVTTIEGLSTRAADGTRLLDPLQTAFVEHGAAQCGFCIPGMIVTARGLLNQHPHATVDEITDALEGNLCRCTGYVKIVEAVTAVVRAG
jgi:carbon-monoxide dehydrogenase small subunit